jgi:hypothetical protein
VTVEGLAAGQTVKGRVNLTPSARSSAGHGVRRFEVFLDGRHTRRYGPAESVDFESEKLPDGYHELRVVAVMNTPVETRGRIILPFFVDNRGRKIECTSAPPHNVFPGQPLIITAKSPGSTEILLFHNRMSVGRIDGEQGEATIDIAQLGSGPIQIQAVGIVAGSPQDYVFGAPLDVQVQR